MDRGYELLDAGDGRRLERFGSIVTDRPAPAAAEPRRDPSAWGSADLVFERGGGWRGGTARERWTVELAGLTLELRPTDSGQVGLFAEQVPNWSWLRDCLARAGPGHDDPVLNLFAYTGGATLASAAAGARVAHVDGSRPAVAWARRNAVLSGLADRPVRWLVDDVETFVAREGRRGHRYRGIVLDPPSYGHGIGGRSWQLEEQLPSLLEACVALADGRPDVFLVTAHTAGFGAGRLATQVASALRCAVPEVEAGDLALDARSGARLSLGAFARWSPRRAETMMAA